MLPSLPSTPLQLLSFLSILTLSFAAPTLVPRHEHQRDPYAPVNFTGTWQQFFVAGAGSNPGAGYELGWRGGSGNYTLFSLLRNGSSDDVLRELVFKNESIHSYIYQFGPYSIYGTNSTFQFEIEDALAPHHHHHHHHRNESSYQAFSPDLPIVTPEQAYGPYTSSASAAATGAA